MGKAERRRRSSDHCCTETVPPSSDHYGTTNVATPSDHLHTKTTLQRKLIGENNSHKFGEGGRASPLATPLFSGLAG